MNAVRMFFAYSKSEFKGVVAICVIVTTALIATYVTGNNTTELSHQERIEALTDSVKKSKKPYFKKVEYEDSSNRAYPSRRITKQKDIEKFDPNTASKETLKRLGFSEKQADVIIKYRNSGAIFLVPEDFLKCYVVSEELFSELKSFIDIDTLNARKISDEAKQISLNKRIAEISVELNSADSAALRSVYGVGAAITRNIMKYRKMLGGFYEIAQLREVYGITDDNFELISKQFYIDSTIIQKININFAPSNELRRHPYITKQIVDKVLRGRKLKGGWINLREMINDDILTEDETRKLSPYLVFH